MIEIKKWQGWWCLGIYTYLHNLRIVKDKHSRSSRKHKVLIKNNNARSVSMTKEQPYASAAAPQGWNALLRHIRLAENCGVTRSILIIGVVAAPNKNRRHPVPVTTSDWILAIVFFQDLLNPTCGTWIPPVLRATKDRYKINQTRKEKVNHSGFSFF